jgi:hypothetical protein
LFDFRGINKRTTAEFGGAFKNFQVIVSVSPVPAVAGATFIKLLELNTPVCGIEVVATETTLLFKAVFVGMMDV